MRRLLLILVFACGGLAHAQTGPLVADSGRFLLRGTPFQIIAGSMHYARVPRAYWRDRLEKARAMGLNTITTYVFWNLHEPSPGHYDFSGQNDIAEYLRIAQQVGLHVILRPGPYVCAEWDLGGYPAWLFADSGIVLRSTDPKFTRPAQRWLDRLGKEVTPLLASHGGPIIAVQVENEYGSFGKDTAYLQWQLAALRHAGFNDVLLYTADGDYQLPHGTLPQLPAVVNFGPGEADSAFARLQSFRPDGPLMTGEYWAGWFDQWGRPHHTTDAAQQTRELAWMLGRGYSVNLYMFHGGTTFGFMNGANIDGGHYHPQTTSYDYDAALDESGRPTPKYYAFRDVIAKHTGITPPPVPDTPPPIAVPAFPLAQAASLWSQLPTPVHVARPRSMETFGQSYGYILYRTTVGPSTAGELVVRDVRDYAQVYVNGALAGTMDRRLDQDSMALSLPAHARLDLLVENAGRVNFARPLLTEQQGITHSVSLAGQELTGWDVYTLPMSSTPNPAFHDGAPAGPAFYRGEFHVAKPGDTFLDMRGWGKGTVWVNGHQLGRFWYIGPQQTLYVPGPWLHRGSNEVVVFDLIHPERRTLAGLAHPILDDLQPTTPAAPAGAAGAQHPEALWYSVGHDASTESFVAHADQIDVVAPQVFAIERDGRIRGHIDPRVVQTARDKHVKLVPLVVNPGFDQALVHRVLTVPIVRRRALHSLADLCRDEHLDGIQFDFENVNVADRDAFTAFVREAVDSVHHAGCTLSAAVVPRASDAPGSTAYEQWLFENWRGVYDYKALADTLDFISYMTYAEHTGGTTPGPVAGFAWMEACLQHLLALGVPPAKISLGIPSYSDWWYPFYSEKTGARSEGRDIPYARAESLLTAHGAHATWDETQQSPYAVWSDHGLFNYLWIEDARAFAAKLALVRQYHLRGYSVWVLGTEDPLVWPAIAAAGRP